MLQRLVHLVYCSRVDVFLHDFFEGQLTIPQKDERYWGDQFDAWKSLHNYVLVDEYHGIV